MLARHTLILAAALLSLPASSCSGPSESKTLKPAASQVKPEPAEIKKEPVRKPLTGTFRTEHRIGAMLAGGEWGEVEVTDVLRVFPHIAGVRVEVELTQTNYHTCHFKHLMLPTADGHWGYRADPDDLFGRCAASLKKVGDSLELTSEGCRAYCGARATLHASFSTRPDDPDPEAFDCIRRCDEVTECSATPENDRGEYLRKCKTRCFNLPRKSADQFDDCVREAADDCRTMLDC